MPLLRNHGDDDAVHRRDHAGIAQIDFFLVDFNLRLHQAGIERKLLGAGGGERGFGGFEVLPRAGFVVQHAALAFETRFGLFQLRLFGLQFGLDDVQRRLGVAQIVALLQIVDVGDRLPFGDAIAQFDLQRFHFTGDPRTDVNAFDGIQSPGGQHGVLDIAQAGRCGNVILLRRALPIEGQRDGDADENDDGDQRQTTGGEFQ